MQHWLLLWGFVIVTTILQVDAYRIVCYYESWAGYYSGNGQFEVEDIDPNLCTHIIYSFVNIESNGQVSGIDEGLINRLKALKSKNSNLKIMAAIGGAGASTPTFSQVVNNAGPRSTFANNIVSFLQKYGLNGFDLDWEYPTNKAAFAALLKTLRPMFDAHGYILSAAVSAGYETVDSAYDVPSLGQYLDFINVMTYDFHGSWDSVTGENAPLYVGTADSSDYSKTLNVDYAIKYWIKKGAPKSKINLGMGTYGRTFTLKDSSNNGVGAPASGPGNPGPYTNGAGMLGYNEICEQHNAGQWEQHWNADQKSMYAFHGNQWVGFDNIAAIKIKTQYIVNNGLGGAMVWAIDTDDFRNTCGDGKFPLVNTIKTYLGN